MVGYDNIENSKENIQLTAAGHRATSLSTSLSKDHSGRLNDQIYIKNKFEERLKSSVAGTSERLNIYYEYVIWLYKAHPEGPPHSKQVVPLLERCTGEYFSMPQFKNDRKYVKLWLVLISSSPADDRYSMFNHLKVNSIGNRLEVFYSEFAKFLEFIKLDIAEADACYRQGIENEAQPIEDLKERYVKFKHRNPVIPTLQTIPSTITQNIPSSKSTFAIYCDTEEPSVEKCTANVAGVPFPREEQRKKENFQIPEKNWTSMPSSQSVHQVPGKKLEIYKDFSYENIRPSYSVELFRHGCSVLSFEQWRLNQILERVPLVQMQRKPAIISKSINADFIEKTELQAPSSAINPIDSVKNGTRSISPEQCYTSYSGNSPTINTKNAMNEIISMFNEKLVSPDDSFSDFESSEQQKQEENFLVYRDEETQKLNPFIFLEKQQQQTPAMPTIIEEASTGKSKTTSINLQSKNSLGSDIMDHSKACSLALIENVNLPNSTPTCPKRVLSNVYSPSPITPTKNSPTSNGKSDNFLNNSDNLFFLTPIFEQQPEVEYQKIYCFRSSYFSQHLSSLTLPEYFDFSSTTLTLNSLVGSTLAMGNSVTYEIMQCLGEGAFAKIFRVSSSSNTEFAMKIQVPPSNWEFYILKRIHSKLVYCNDLMIRPLNYFSYANCSVLLTELGSCGTLLDCANGYLEKNEKMNEFVVIYIMMELLKIVNELHSNGFIHGDIKCENILISDDSDVPPIKLFDFGRSIDTNLDNLNICRYFCNIDEEEPFPAIRNGLPFTYEIDYFGIASVAYVLLFQQYIELVQKQSESNHALYSIKRSLIGLQNTEFWRLFFDFFINAKCTTAEPLIKHLQAFITEMQSILNTCGNFQLLYNKHCWEMIKISNKKM